MNAAALASRQEGQSLAGGPLYLSVQPRWWGGGSNTFAWNMRRFARKRGIPLARRLEQAGRAIVVAHQADLEAVRQARSLGCLVIHRIDEDFRADPQDAYRRQKHEQILRLNEHADVTVFQSEFVRCQAEPLLKPRRHVVILNGGDPEAFRPARRPGSWIGHVTWGVGDKKRLDLLFECIRAHPRERFLLVGNHARSSLPFRSLPNARLVGRALRFLMPWLLRRMRVLFFPSQDDPCPNTAVEAILSGVPVCYNERGGTSEIVRDCGLPLDRFDELCRDAELYRQRCIERADLDFAGVAESYLSLV